MDDEERADVMATRVMDFMVENALTSVQALYETRDERYVIEATNGSAYEVEPKVEVRTVDL